MYFSEVTIWKAISFFENVYLKVNKFFQKYIFESYDMVSRRKKEEEEKKKKKV